MGKQVRLTGGKHTTAEGTEYFPGDVFEPTERERRILSAKGKIEPIEAKTSPTPTNPLPEDLPGRREFFQAGFTRLEAIQVLTDYTQVKGIGKVTAQDVRSYFGEAPSEEETEVETEVETEEEI